MAKKSVNPEPVEEPVPNLGQPSADDLANAVGNAFSSPTTQPTVEPEAPVEE